MGKIWKISWFPHELIVPSENIHILVPASSPNRLQEQIALGEKTMLCAFWDQRGIFLHELLKSGEMELRDSFR